MVGLTGGIGAGKSVVASRLAGLGAVVIDSDRLAREVVAPGTDGLREIVAAFGGQVLGADGALNRPALGEVVFGDDAARTRLEKIVHPRVRALSAGLVAAAPADAVVVNDVPLLVEAGLAPTYHLVVVVEASRAGRIDRLVRNRGISVDQAEQRIRAQVGDAERRVAADVVLTNDADLTDLHRRVDALWRERLLPYERNVRERRAAPAPTTPVPADPSWPVQYARLAARIRHALGRPDLPVEHVGPTAAPAPTAPDVIDLRLTLGSWAEAEQATGPLAGAGFPRCPGGSDVPGGSDIPGGAEGAGYRHGNADPARPARLYVQVRPGG